MTKQFTVVTSAPARWGSGKIFSPLHRLVYSWVLSTPEWVANEEAIVEVFGSKRRRSMVMKTPTTITAAEVDGLAELMKITPEALHRVAVGENDPELDLTMSESTGSPNHSTDATQCSTCSSCGDQEPDSCPGTPAS